MSASDRSGTKQRLESLRNSILNYLDNTKFDRESNVDRVVPAIAQRPEDFIRPNPGVPYKEDLSSNWNRVKQEFSLTPIRDLEQQAANFPDQLRDYIERSVRDVIDDAGAIKVAQYIYEDVPIGDPDAEQTIDDLLEEVPPDIFLTEIESRLAQLESAIGRDLTGGVGGISDDPVAQDAISRIEGVTGRQYASLEGALDDIETEIRNANRLAEQRAVDRLSAAFGRRFDSIDDAIERLRDTIANLQQLDIATVEASFLGGEDTPNVSLPAGYLDLTDDVRAAIEDTIDLEATADALPSRNRPVPFADVRVRQGQIEQIDYGKSIENPNIILVENPDLGIGEDAPDNVDPDSEGIESISSVPLDATPEEPEEPEPDTEPDVDVDAEDLNDEAVAIADRAIEAYQEDGLLEALAGELSVSEAFTLAAAIDRGSIRPSQVETLTEAFQSAGQSNRESAARLNDGITEVQRRLIGDPGEFASDDTADVEVFERDPGDFIPDAEGGTVPPGDDDSDGITQDDVFDRRGVSDISGDIADDVVDRLLGDESSDIQSRSGSNRPDPNQRQAADRIARLFGGRTMKADAWVSAEQDRLARSPDPQNPVPPADYWDQFGSRVWGSTISKGEFVNLTVDGF